MTTADVAAPPPGGLARYRVVELADWIAGPHAASILGDFGAEVIRIERPDGVDHARGRDTPNQPQPRSKAFAVTSRNKKSLAVDVHTVPGLQILFDLLDRSDVFVTNLRPDSLERLGVGIDTLEKRFPRLVIICISGFGLTGPLRGRGAFDGVAQAFGGMTYVTGSPDGPPTRAGLMVADFMTGWLAALGGLVALEERHVSGRGQVVDMALYESIASMLQHQLIAWATEGSVAERTGNIVASVSPGGTFPTSDGHWIQMSASSDKLFHSLMEVVGRPDLARDDRFRTMSQRRAGRQELLEAISAWTSTHPLSAIFAALDESGVPCANVNSVADLAIDAHVLERGTILTVKDDEFGPLPAVAPLPRLSRTPGRIRATGPIRGAHTVEILTDVLGLDPDRIAELAKDRVVEVVEHAC